MTIVIGTMKLTSGKYTMNLNNVKPVQYAYKSTTAFDDQYEVGFEAQEVEQLIPEAVYKFRDPEPNNIVCMAGGTEMLKIGPEGFWVRGVKVAQDEREAEAVYNAFKQWLVWSEMNRR
jgi:hypothetical protein